MNIQWFCENIYANSGYSDEARVMVRELEKNGIKIKIIGQNKKPELKEFEFQNHIDPGIPIIYHTFRHGKYSLYRQQYSIVRTMLEVSRIPQSWVYRFNNVDEIWVPNAFNFDVFQRSGVIKEKIFIIPSPVDFSFVNDITEFKLKTQKKFIFFSLFSYENRDRKGIDILLKAYTEAFNKNADVCLLLKTKTTLENLRVDYKLAKYIPEIKVINEVLDRKSLLSLYGAVSCFVLPSRGEGIGRPYLDAMMTGVPIIATSWSGNKCFLNGRNSFQVKYKLVDVDKKFYLKYPGFFGAKWAEPDLEDLKEKMQFVFNNYDQAQKKALESKNDIFKLNARNVARDVIERLKNPLSKKKRKKGSANIFERLMPLYYPELRGKWDIGQINRNDFKKKIKSVIIVGTGYRARKAFDFIFFQARVRRIFFMDHNLEFYPYMNFPSIDLTKVLKLKKNIDIIVFTLKIKDLKEIFDSLIKIIDSIPVYIFD